MNTNYFSNDVDFEVLNSISEKYNHQLWTIYGGLLDNDEYTPIQESALMLREGGFDTEDDAEFNVALAKWFIDHQYACDEDDFSNEYNDNNYNWEEIYKDAAEIAYDIINTYFDKSGIIAC